MQFTLWERVWDQVAEMEGLRYLKVYIGKVQGSGFFLHLSVEDERKILGPLEKVRQTKKFHVSTSWFLVEGGWNDISGMPYCFVEHNMW